jgi:hypothetical protein
MTMIKKSKLVLSLLVILLTGNITCVTPFVPSEWASKHVCTWSAYDEATFSATDKMNFFNERISTLMNPLTYRFVFKGIAQCGYLDLEHYNGEFRPLMWEGKFIKKDGTFITNMDDVQSSNDLVYKSY